MPCAQVVSEPPPSRIHLGACFVGEAVVREIILGGKRCAVDAPAVTWEQSGLTFVGKPNTKRRVQKPDVVIWHWTGGENSAATTYNTLIQRSLGVSFCIERDGTIYQYLDPVLWDPQDVGGAMGKRSISIEVANYGILLPRHPGPSRGRDRVVDDEVIHGQKVRCSRFYPVQISSIEALTITLCSELCIPLRFPREKSGEIAYRALLPREARVFTGVIGHFHKTDKKFDPGFQIFRDLESLEQR